jgi:hypothetical protein
MCRLSVKCIVKRVLKAAWLFFSTVGIIAGVLLAGFFAATAVLWAIYFIYIILTNTNPGVVATVVLGIITIMALIARLKN